MTDPLLRLVDLKTHFQTKGAGLFGEKKVLKAYLDIKNNS